jgi:hypothetical protein
MDGVCRKIGLGMTSAALLIGLTSIVSCKSGSTNAPERSTSSTKAPAPTTRPTSHWVQDKRLRTLMAELSKRNPNWPASMPQEPESPQKARDEDFNEVAREANGLMLAAEKLPDLTASLKMNEADREGFLAQARVLHDQARRLRDAARQRNVEQMQQDMIWLNSTCLSCHSRYRDFSGQLDSTRADSR